MIKRIACIDPSPLETILAVQALLFGLFLLLPEDTLGSSQVYYIMALVASENVWAIIFTVTGIVSIYAIHRPGQNLRRWCATISLFLWLFVDLSAWISNGKSAATVTYLTVVLVAAWAVIAITAREYFRCDH